MKQYLTKTLLISFLVLLAATTLIQSQSQFAVGSIIRGFELPQTDKDGNPLLRITGEEATVISENRIQIKGLSVELFDKNSKGARFVSKESDFWPLEQKLTTDKGIQILYPGVEMSSDLLEWNLAESKGVLSKKVRVVLKGEKMDLMKGK
jgi:hypothetical protein